MPQGKFIKGALEIKRYSADYDNWLDLGETLTNLQFAILPATIPALTVSGLAIEPSGRAAQFLVSGGVNGTNYEILLSANTSGGQLKQDVLVYNIREPN